MRGNRCYAHSSPADCEAILIHGVYERVLRRAHRYIRRMPNVPASAHNDDAVARLLAAVFDSKL